MALLTYLCVSSISPAVQRRTPLKLRQYQRGAAARAEPTKSQGIPWTPRQNILGYCFICIGFKLCLRSIVGLPGSCACLLRSLCSARCAKGEPLRLCFQLVWLKHLSGES